MQQAINAIISLATHSRPFLMYIRMSYIQQTCLKIQQESTLNRRIKKQFNNKYQTNQNTSWTHTNQS